MKLNDVFQKANGLIPLPEQLVEWDNCKFCCDVIEILRAAQNRVQAEGLDLAEYSGLVHQDIQTIKLLTPEFKAVFDLLQFDNATTVMGHASQTKQVPLLWEWTVRSLFDGKVDGKVEWTPYDRILELSNSPRAPLKELFSESFIIWSEHFYYAARIIGNSFNSLAHQLFEKTILLGCSALDSQESEIQEQAAQVLGFTLNWDVVNGPSELGKKTSDMLYRFYLQDRLSKRTLATLGMMFATQVGEAVQLDLGQEANRVLDKYSNELVAHERLQLLASIVSIDIENKTDRHAELIDEIKSYYISLRKASGNKLLMHCYEKGAIFGILEPLLIKALKAQKHAFALNVISAWKNEIAVHDAAHDALISVTTHTSGVSYYSTSVFWEGNHNSKQAEQNLRALIETTNKAMGSVLNIPNDENFTLVQPERLGCPDYTVGPQYEEALRLFYLPENVRPFLQKNKAGFGRIIPIPYISSPIQALFLKELNVSLPLSVSCRKPNNDRNLNKALIYANGVMTLDYELNEVTRMLEDAGVACHTIKTDAKEKFLELYSSETYDLIWIIAHGEYDQYQPHQSRIPTELSGSISIQDLMLFDARDDSRRLLVLNICSGANGAMLGGMMDLGIGPLLSNNHQAVISHLWPVSMWQPVIFGSLLAGNLAKHGTYFDSFTETVRTYSAGVNQIVLKLQQLDCSNEVIRHAECIGNDWTNIFHWGSPVFLE